MAGSLIVISGPSGVGKGTLVKLVMERMEGLWLSVSCTTRAPREGEEEGVTYFFITPERFDQLIEEDGFLEWAWVHETDRYGTPRVPVEKHLEMGEDVLLEIDVQGGLQIQERVPDAKLVFILPPSMEELESRLRGRGTETEEQIQRRLHTAELELCLQDRYTYRVMNDDLETAVNELIALIEDIRQQA